MLGLGLKSSAVGSRRIQCRGLDNWNRPLRHKIMYPYEGTLRNSFTNYSGFYMKVLLLFPPKP